MILVDWRIKELLKEGDLVIDPIDQNMQIGPASIDLTLSSECIKFNENVMEDVPKHIGHIWSGLDSTKYEYNELRLAPKQFGLFTTREIIKLPINVTGQLEGRSSIGRQGIFVHNAGFIDPGFCGQITLELFNATDHTVMIPAGTMICQLVLFDCDVPERSYAERTSSKYISQQGVTLSKLNEELIKNG